MPAKRVQGKAPYLKIIAGLLQPDCGEVVYGGENMLKGPADNLVPGHPQIAYLSQHFELSEISFVWSKYWNMPIIFLTKRQLPYFRYAGLIIFCNAKQINFLEGKTAHCHCAIADWKAIAFIVR
ncbi:MAG: hypothetical protein U5K54_07765 [Cytophagales bacterium]|nr:hypothetical protein [Cytophagales bacterium]